MGPCCTMGAWPTSLRKAISRGDEKTVHQILTSAGNQAANLINMDFSQDCIMKAYQPAVGNALYYAVFKGETGIALMLLKYGADPHSTGYNDETVLHLAARANQLSIIKSLLDHGADIWATDDLGRTVLHNAARSPFNTRDVMIYLCDKMKDPEAVNNIDYAGRTPLHDGVCMGTVENVKTLLMLGADPLRTSRVGVTALQLARHLRRHDVEKVLTEEPQNLVC